MTSDPAGRSAPRGTHTGEGSSGEEKGRGGGQGTDNPKEEGVGSAVRSVWLAVGPLGMGTFLSFSVST